ncbi:MAG: hypothetical protein A2Y25_01250 [Candidatus Melainabacteria bacterium GWF2_37_15]|nr:MAG: hypothetical protein A2Y25_01250 [Candidatus Melainabacteria bacterium GWF2_37_15]
MNEMQHTIAKKIRYTKFSSVFPKFGLSVLLLTIFCSFLIVIATFTPIPLNVITFPGANLNSFDELIKVLNYIPQVPVIVMIASWLGYRAGFLAVLLYVVAGLVGVPVFASGGGLDYLAKIRFGYILGFFAGIYVTGKLISKKTNLKRAAVAAIIGVIAVHIIGVIYLTVVLFIQQEPINAIFSWMMQLSGMQIFYDLIFSIFAAFIGRLLRHVFWVVTN